MPTAATTAPFAFRPDSASPLLPGECPATFATFERELEEELRPRSSVQRLIFTQIRNLLWKLQRLPDAERKLFELEARQRPCPGEPRVRPPASSDEPSQGEADPPPPPSPSEILAMSFAEHGSRSPFHLLARHERTMQNTLLRLMAKLKQLQKEPPPTYDDDAADTWQPAGEEEEAEHRDKQVHEPPVSAEEQAWWNQQLADVRAHAAARGWPPPPPDDDEDDEELTEAAREGGREHTAPPVRGPPRPDAR